VTWHPVREPLLHTKNVHRPKEREHAWCTRVAIARIRAMLLGRGASGQNWFSMRLVVEGVRAVIPAIVMVFSARIVYPLDILRYLSVEGATWGQRKQGWRGQDSVPVSSRVAEPFGMGS